MTVARIDEILCHDVAAHLQACKISVETATHLRTGKATGGPQLTRNQATVLFQSYQYNLLDTPLFRPRIKAAPVIAEIGPPFPADKTGLTLEELAVGTTAFLQDGTLPFPQRKETNKMRIQYMSDLHLEFQENNRYLRYNELPVTGDVLVLAGDIFYLKDKTAPVMNFWKWASKNYRQVLIVPGNHEYYNYSDVMERGFQWKWMLRENAGYYQNQVVRIDDTDFVLSTLWSHINPNDEYFVWKSMNDFRQIKFGGKLLQVEEFNRMHEICIDFIRKNIEESTANHIVVV